MDFILCKTQDADNVIGKVGTDAITLDILLKGDVDIKRPSITLVRVAGVDFLDFNYCHIPELEMYYFIRGYDIVSAKLTVLELELDYLETYKAKILASQAKYVRKIRVGDYGDMELDVTGRDSVTDLVSDVALVSSDFAILSLLNGEED